MDAKAPLKAIDDWQQSHKVTAVLYGVVKKFGEDKAGNLAALIAYFAFFSLFPLLLAFTTILALVLTGNQSALHSVEHSVLGQFPVIGPSLQGRKLHGNAAGLIIGLALAIFAGLGVTTAAGHAMDVVWEVPEHQRPGFVAAKLRGLLLLVSLGGLFILATAVSGAVTGGLGGPGVKVAGYVLSLLLNFALFMIAFRVLCSEERSWKELVPGSIMAAIGWLILQTLGGLYINHTKNSSPANGTFALVIGVLAWLHLGALLMLYSAELNTVLAKKAWPRSILKSDE